MIRKGTLLFLLCLFTNGLLHAQKCATDVVQRHLAAQDPAGYAQKIADATQKWVAAHTITATGQPPAFLLDNGIKRVYQIPLAVHIITTGGAVGTIYNPTDAQINTMINYLNQTYNGTWSAYPDSNSGGVSIPIQFVLAQRDSNCNPTTGIERIDGSGVANYVSGGIDAGSGTGANEVSVKNLSRWPLNEYYNVWIVNKINGADGTGSGVFTAGYAYLAQATSPSVDGIVMLATQANQGDITLPHELGHALSLLHTFEGNDPNGTGANNCPANNNCLTDGDQICDTQPEMQSEFDCPADPNPCTGASYQNVQHNFMDYSSCQDRFTAGQRARMIFGLMTYRQVLLGSAGVLNTDTMVAGTTCIPTITNPSNTYNAGPREVKIADTYTNTYINAAYTYLDYPSNGYNTDGVYMDMSCKQQANLNAGSTYRYFVKAGPSSVGEKVRVYIDYNNNGIFEPSLGELIYSHDGNAANQLDSADITMPTAITHPGLILNRPLRMRVISDRASVTTVDSCGAIGYGQAEDYSVLLRGTDVNANDTVTISLPAGTDTSCTGSTLTFTATVNADAVNYTYEWFVNNAATGVTTSTFTTNTLVDGDAVFCRIYYTYNSLPDSATSNIITVHRYSSVVPSVAITETTGTNPACTGHTVVFTAIGSFGGPNPMYQWNINNVPVSGATNNVFSGMFNSGDVITCTFTSSYSCAVFSTVSSNAITLIVNPSMTPGISDSIIQGSNPGCLDSVVVFGGSATNFGSNPNYTWLVNNVAVANGATFSSSSLQNGDVVVLRVNQTDGGCYTSDTLLSAPIVLVRDTTPNSPLISLIGNQLVSNDIQGTYVWYGPDGLISGATSYTYHPTELGDYYAERVYDGCPSPPSNILYVSLLDIKEYNLSQVKVYPNPTNGKLVLDWGAQPADMKIDVYNILGQGLKHEEVDNQTKKVLDLSAFANGNYFIVLKDKDGSTATMKITVMK